MIPIEVGNLKPCEKHPDRYCNCEGFLPACREASASPFPQPDRNRKGKEPCGECHVQPGETCDICGASSDPEREQLPPKTPGTADALPNGSTKAAIAGWNACRRQVYALSEDYIERTHALKDADTVEGHFYRGQYDVAKAFAKAFNALDPENCDEFGKILG